ncbi:MAG: heparinase II/III family protein, partial [Victivallales bacterium]|nr:heparinase II/III family protein [Victivallales bacterium]
GFRSTLMVASAAINMLGYSSEAAASLEFLIPRMRRVLEKLPLDGYIPFAQYHTISLCVNALCEFRLAYLFASGNDVFDITSAFGGIPCYILSTYDEQSMSVFTSCTRGDRKDFKDSLSFFMMTEEKYVCRISAYLRSCIMEHYLRESRGKLSPSVLATIPSAILAWNGTEFTSSAKPEFEALNVFQDGGGVHYRFDPARFTVAVMCHPNAPSHHSIGTDMNSTDRALSNPSSGAFSVAVGDEVLIQNAESGYRTGSELGNVLLVDGRGQIGDVGYPMGVPMRRWRGDRIQSWRTAEDGDGGFARLLLTAAYPDESGVLRYTRDFHFDGASTRVVDTVVSSEKHNFEYRFNTYQDHDIERLSDTEFVIRGAEAALNLSISSADWDVSIADTDVVWSYVNEHDGRPFKHLRIALRKPVEAFALEFVVNSV